MTAQVNDAFLLDDQEFVIAGIESGELLPISRFDLLPTSPHTACWRGYVMDFALDDEQLVLDRLKVHLTTFHPELGPMGGEPQRGPIIHGVEPAFGTDRSFSNVYENLRYPVDYTGGVLVARDFVHDLYVHMGFQDWWKYDTVIELIFDNGRLIKRRDGSADIPKIREAAMQQEGPGDLMTWIERTFDRRY